MPIGGAKAAVVGATDRIGQELRCAGARSTSRPVSRCARFENRMSLRSLAILSFHPRRRRATPRQCCGLKLTRDSPRSQRDRTEIAQSARWCGKRAFMCVDESRGRGMLFVLTVVVVVVVVEEAEKGDDENFNQPIRVVEQQGRELESESGARRSPECAASPSCRPMISLGSTPSSSMARRMLKVGAARGPLHWNQAPERRRCSDAPAHPSRLCTGVVCRMVRVGASNQLDRMID